MGRYSSEALGDYCAGPNHVLPTSRTARFSSTLGGYDLQKRTSLIDVSRAGAQTMGRIAASLASGEIPQFQPARQPYRSSPFSWSCSCVTPALTTKTSTSNTRGRQKCENECRKGW